MKPTCEVQVREIAAMRSAAYGYLIVTSREAFPDWVVRTGDGADLRIEVEKTSADFVRHGHDPSGCDLVICWLHTRCLPIPVTELSTNRTYLPFAVPSEQPRRLRRTNYGTGRSVVLKIRVMDDELAQIRNGAGDTSISSWARDALLAEARS